MSLYLCLKEDATSVVSNDNPLSTKHSSSGEPQTIVAYVANDGKRNGVANDTIQQLIYTNLQVRISKIENNLFGSNETIEHNRIDDLEAKINDIYNRLTSIGILPKEE